LPVLRTQRAETTKATVLHNRQGGGVPLTSFNTTLNATSGGLFEPDVQDQQLNPLLRRSYDGFGFL
jgi:hypothetical protein